MLVRWEYGSGEWYRDQVIRHTWVSSDDPVELGEQRALLVAESERLEEARVAALNERSVLDEELAEQRVLGERTRQLADSLARDVP